MTSSGSVGKGNLAAAADRMVRVVRSVLRAAWFRCCELRVSAARTSKRRLAVKLVPGLAAFVFLATAAYGYFVPVSPVFGKVYYKANTSEKVVALTFDDGPNDPYTSEILDVLDRYNIKGTFFAIGQNVEHYPETARRIVAGGHVIGNHSYSHNANHALTLYGAKDMERAQTAIASVVGVVPHLYRGPHGKKSPWELSRAEEDGLIDVTWSVATGELHVDSAAILAERIVSKTDPGEIILLHDGYGMEHNSQRANKSLTVKALPLIIDQLQAKGYRFVTVPQLLGVPAYNN